MVKTKKKIFKKNITNRKNRNGSNLSYYAVNFEGTELIPRTSIMNYLFNNYYSFLNLKRESNSLNKEVVTMNDCFNIGNKFDIINAKGGKISLNTTIEGNKNFSIDKIISYAFYTKSKDIFDSTNNPKEIAKLLKYQMGKDIHRDNRTINGEEYGTDFFAQYSKDYYKCTDEFYKINIDYLHKISRNIDYNLVNKLALLSCQSMYNFIIDLISHQLMQQIRPEVVNITQAEKSQVITLTNNKQEVEFKFKSKAYITYNGEIMDITNPCANLDFALLFDFKNKKYKFTKFIFEYDYDVCKSPEAPEFISEDSSYLTKNAAQTESSTNKLDNEKQANNKVLYGLSAALGAAGAVSVPFILGALGGKKHIKNKNKNKNKKEKTKTKRKYIR